MNPRLFCRERSYHKALLLTYSFDPIFFEQVVLPDLWAGRSSDILVLGDRAQIEASTQAAAGSYWLTGRLARSSMLPSLPRSPDYRCLRSLRYCLSRPTRTP